MTLELKLTKSLDCISLSTTLLQEGENYLISGTKTEL